MIRQPELRGMQQEPLLLPVVYHQQAYEFPFRVQRFGYSYRIEVDMEGATVLFERDEEGNWRAVMGYEDLVAGKKVGKGLLEAVAGVLDVVTE
mgnify:CR=1 FL=1